MVSSLLLHLPHSFSYSLYVFPTSFSRPMWLPLFFCPHLLTLCLLLTVLDTALHTCMLPVWLQLAQYLSMIILCVTASSEGEEEEQKAEGNTHNFHISMHLLIYLRIVCKWAWAAEHSVCIDASFCVWLVGRGVYGQPVFDDWRSTGLLLSLPLSIFLPSLCHLYLYIYIYISYQVIYNMLQGTLICLPI